MNQLLTMGWHSRSEVSGGLRSRMKNILALALLTILGTMGPGFTLLCSAQEDGVALAIIYDTSGSMKDRVPDQSGGASPKYVIANRALMSMAQHIQAFATNNASGSARKIHAALFVFQGEHGQEAIKMAPFDA